MSSAASLAASSAPGASTLNQQQRQQQQQQQQPSTAAAPAIPGAVPGYDLSSLDQLQAHALQLSASAGLTNLMFPNGQQLQAPVAGGQSAGAKQQQPFFFLQPAGNGQHGLQQQLINFGTPAAQQQQQQQGNGNMNNNGQYPGQPAPVPAGFGFDGSQPGQAPIAGISIPAQLQQLFAAQGGAAGLQLFSNGTAQPAQQQSYSSAGIPIPMSMMIPQQLQQQQQQQQQGQTQSGVAQQQQQQAQLQPLQPAPPAAAKNDAASAMAGMKRPHDSSAISSSSMSIGSNPSMNIIGGGGILSGPSTDMNDYPEFQLRNKDGSIITEKDLEKMTPAERRRYERNLREQQRSFRISQQIQQLRDVLSESKVPFKPNKYSILVSVADYIKQLQTRAIMLDSEHKKLFKTIQETNEMVASGQIPDPNTATAAARADNNNVSSKGFESNNNDDSNTDEGDRAFVQGLDYHAVFDQTPTANGVASIDGRILACNKELENILECPREQIERQSLFTMVQNHQEIFEAMAELLKRADALSKGTVTADPVQLLYWSGQVLTPAEKKVSFLLLFFFYFLSSCVARGKNLITFFILLYVCCSLA